MKNLVLLCLIFSAYAANSQTHVYKMAEADKKFKRDSLQEVYFDRIFTEEISTCFDVPQEVFLDEWTKYVRSIGKYLTNNNFIFGKRLSANVELFFDANENITLFFIQIKDTEFQEERYPELFRLLEKFIAENKFKVDAKIPFSNFGTVMFMN